MIGLGMGAKHHHLCRGIKTWNNDFLIACTNSRANSLGSIPGMMSGVKSSTMSSHLSALSLFAIIISFIWFAAFGCQDTNFYGLSTFPRKNSKISFYSIHDTVSLWVLINNKFLSSNYPRIAIPANQIILLYSYEEGDAGNHPCKRDEVWQPLNFL